MNAMELGESVSRHYPRNALTDQRSSTGSLALLSIHFDMNMKHDLDSTVGTDIKLYTTK